MSKVIRRLYNRLCRRKLERLLPGILSELKTYSKGSDTTGTQWITLWFAVKGILRHKPRHILECGTGSSTLVLAAAVQKLKREYPDYDGHITSMESIEQWFTIASECLPERYKADVEIIYGPREKFEMGFFRGFIHSNIPKKDYSFVFLDGPNFFDEHGLAFCADIFKVMDLSNAKLIHGVVDARVSSVFVLQTIFGPAVARYWHSLFAASFTVPNIDFRDVGNKSTRNFATSLAGSLTFTKFRRNQS